MNSEDVLVSILVANYNNGCYLQQMIDSVLMQTYVNWEIIIVDDCSTDESLVLYKVLEVDPRIHFYFNDKNMGAGYAKHRCVENASGEICGFVDPDDLLAVEDAIEVMVRAHRENPDVSMVYSGFYATNENLEIISEERGRDLEGISGLESCSWPFKHFVTFKKEYYLKTVGINPLMRRAVDYDLYFKLEEVGRVLHLDKILYLYRHNSHSISLNDGEYKSRAWLTYACIEAMKRRGLAEERFMLFPIEDAMEREFKRGVIRAQKSMTFQLGLFFSKPLLLLKKWFLDHRRGS